MQLALNMRDMIIFTPKCSAKLLDEMVKEISVCVCVSGVIGRGCKGGQFS